MAALSLGLSKRIVAAFDRGGRKQKEVAELFSVSAGTLSKLLRQRRETGDLAPLHSNCKGKPKILAADATALSMFTATEAMGWFSHSGYNFIQNALILLKCAKSRSQYPELIRRVEMLVEVDGKEAIVVFITNNTQWAATSVGALNKPRWGIEVFFKQIKQTL